MRTEPEFLAKVVETAIAAGATTVNIPDTVGYSTPQEIGEIFAEVARRVERFPDAVISAHCHNDLGMAVANTLSAVATLAFDCRRSAFFTDQFYAALELVQAGNLDVNAKGAAHGEIGQTQFLPRNVIRFGVDGDGDGHIDMVRSRADALASTANFLRGHGWQPGAGYQQGEPNYAAIQGWNAAGVYQQAIAYIGARIDAE